MKSDAQSKFMKYGDYITLLGTTSNIKHGNTQGFLSCVGFSDTRVFFQKVPNDSLLQAMKQTYSLGAKNQKEHLVNPLSFLRNTQDLVFQVWPRLNFEAHKEYRKSLKEKEKMRAKMSDRNRNNKEESRGGLTVLVDLNDSTSPIKTNKVTPLVEAKQNKEQRISEQQIFESIEHTLNIFKERIKVERELNDQQLLHFLGENVSYGNDIQLLHINSRMFLNGKILASEAEKSAYQFELSDSFSGGMIFKFMPKFKLRQIGEAIQYNDMLIIQNTKLSCFINFNLDATIELDRAIEQSQTKNILPITDLRQNDPRTPRYETFLSLFSDTSWQVIKHGKGQQNDENPNNIRGGQIIMLKHTELSEPLTCDSSYIINSPEAFLRLYTGNFPQEYKNLRSLWQVERDTPFNKGSFLHYQTRGDKSPYFFRLRHVLSGRLLGSTEITIKGVKKDTLALLPDEDLKQNSKYDLSTRIIFLPTIKSEEPTLRSSECYQIKVGDKYLKTMVNPEYDTGNVTSPHLFYTIKKPLYIENFYQELNESELTIERKGVELTQRKSDEDAFWIEVIGEELTQQIGYIASTLPHLHRFVQILRDNQSKMLTNDYLRHVNKTINNLIYYTTDTPIYESKPGDNSNQSVQRMLKNCNLLEYLTMILYYPFNNGMIKEGGFSQVPIELLRVLSSCYRLIKVTIKEYRPNELYMSQWIELLLNQAMIKDDYHDIEAGQTLTELIDNNRFVLEHKIKPQTIERFVKELLKTRDVKYIGLLRALINCDGEAMVGSQSEISQKILQKENQKILIPAMEFDGTSIQIQIQGQTTDLNDFKVLSFELDNEQSFTYFVNLVSFLSDLCLDKNFLAIEPLQEVFSLEMCKHIVRGKQYDDKLRSAFAQLILTLWIEGKQLEKIQMPNLVRTWEEIDDEEGVNLARSSTREQLQVFRDMKSFITEHINLELSRGFQRTFNEDQNSLTYQILKICYAFLTYGFYQDQSEIKELIQPLIGYLNSSNDVTNNEEERAKKSELNILAQSDKSLRRKRIHKQSGKNMFKTRYEDNEDTAQLSKCRAQVCKMLLYIYQIINDIRATYFLKAFKKDYLNPDEVEEPKKDQKQSAFSKFTNLIPINLDDFNIFKLFQNNEDTPDLLPLKWIKQILEMKDIDLFQEYKDDLAAILMDLIMYQNVELISNAFTLLDQSYSHKVALVHYLKGIQIIDDAGKMKLLEDVRELRRTIQTRIDNSENWWGLDNQKAIVLCQEVKQQVESLKDILIKGVERAEKNSSNQIMKKISGAESQLQSPKVEKEIFIGRKQESKNNEEDELISKQFVKKPFIREHQEFELGISESDMRKQIKPEFQKMMRNLELYKPLVQLINFDITTLQQKQESKRSTELMRCVYQFLAYFCFDNQINRQILRPYLKQFRTHFKKNKDVLSHLVLQEIFRNNRIILMNQKKLNKVLNELCGIMQGLNMNDPLKVFLLDSLCIYMKVEGRVLKQNQITVLNCLGTHQSLLFLLETPEELNSFGKKVKEFNQNFENVVFDQNIDNPEVKVPHEINYFLVLLRVMSTTAEEKNAAAESRCQAYFPISKIYNLLKASPKTWPLRRGLAQYYFDVYLDIEKDIDDKENMNPLMIEELVNDVLYFSQHHQDILISQAQIVTFNQVILGREFLFDYLNSVVVPILLITIKTNLLYSCKNVEHIFKRLVESIYNFQDCRSEILIQNMSLILMAIENNRKINKDIGYTTTLKKQVPQSLNRNIKKIFKEGRFTPKRRESTIQFVKLADKGVNSIFSDKLEKLSKHERFSREVEDDIEDMVTQVIQIDKLTSTKLKTVVITFEEIMAQMIKLVDPRSDPLPNHLCMVGLKIFRKIIEKENLDEIRPASEWEQKDFAIYQKKIAEKQNELVKNGLADVICSIISMDSQVDLKNEAILVGIAMLLGGNTKTQTAFYNYLQTDTKNRMMLSLKTIIETNLPIIKRFSDRKNKDRENSIEERDNIKTVFDEPAADQNAQGSQDEQKENSQIMEHTTSNPDQFELKTIETTRRVFRFLQLFCEGHNLEMQNYLRIQTQDGSTNGKTINLINFSSLRFGSLMKSMSIENLVLVSQMIDFLIESIQGPCLENQESMAASKIVDFCNELISLFSTNLEYEKRGFVDEEQQDQVNNLVSKSTKLLLSLIEANQTTFIANFLTQNLELQFIKKRLCDVYRQFVSNTLNLPLDSPIYRVNARTYEVIDFFEGSIGEAFDMFILLASLDNQLRSLGDENLVQHLLQEKDDEEINENAMEFYRLNSASVEVFFKDRLVRVFFPVAPTCRNLSVQSRRILMQTVKRDSPNDKINGLMSEAPTMFTEMSHMSWLKRLPFQFRTDRLDIFRDLSTIVALLINIILIISYKKVLDHNQTSTSPGTLRSLDTGVLIRILGLIQLVTSSLMLTFWLIINAPVILKSQWMKFVEENRLMQDQKLDEQIDEVNLDPTKYTTNQITYLFRTKGPYSIYFMRGDQMFLGSLFAKILYYIRSFIYLCSDPSFIYMFFYIIISIIAGIGKNEILYCFHLLDFINRSEMLKNVVRAVTNNFYQLILTMFLMSIIIYIYTMIGYFFLQEGFYNVGIGSGESTCETVLHCYLTTIQKGLLNGGGISESLEKITYNDKLQVTFWVRFIYDVSFFVIITVMLLNIVFGIIIDSFAELRDEKKSMNDDMTSKCYICGLDRYQFEKNADGFKNHIERDHQLWNYLYFAHYLENKDSTDHNGIESYCVELNEKLDIQWFPIMKAISLGENDEENSLSDKLSGTLQGICNTVKTVQKSIDAIKIDKKKGQQQHQQQ